MRLTFQEEKEQTSGWRGHEGGRCSSFMVWALYEPMSFLISLPCTRSAPGLLPVLHLPSQLQVTINVVPSAWNVLFASLISSTKLEVHHLDLRFPQGGSFPLPPTPDEFCGWGNGVISLGSIITLHCNPSDSYLSFTLICKFLALCWLFRFYLVPALFCIVPENLEK